MDTPTYPLVLERMRRRFEERALLVPEVIPTRIKQLVQGFLFPAPYRHPGQTPRPDTQAQQPGTGQQQQTWLKHNTMQADGVQPTTTSAPPEGVKVEDWECTELGPAPPSRGYRDTPTPA